MISLSSDDPAGFFGSKITAVSIKPPQWKLGGRGLFFAGSCFAENLHREFEAARLQAMISPFGNIYNPVSLAQAAELMAAGGGIEAGDCFEQGGEYYHFMFHTLIHESSPSKLAYRLNSELAAAKLWLSRAEAVVITLGTAFVYRLKDSGSVVNNCHRVPAGSFDRECLSAAGTADALRRSAAAFLSINPNLKIIITLSPVRHLRDNAAGNSLSKAVLRCGIDEFCREFPEHGWYYPSYEIMLDELRDYRWYSTDLCHPSDEAVSYIISRFIGAAYDDEFKSFLRQWLQVLRDLNHRPLAPESDEYLKFLAKVKKKEKDIAARYPGLTSGSGQ